QDVARWARRMGIPCNPPPPTTDPTPAGLGSLLAEEKGCLRDYVIEVMRCEWAGSNDIGQREVLIPIAESVGLSREEFEAVLDDPASQKQLDDNWLEAQESGVIGVPTFIVNDQLFWGNDRIDFLEEYLMELRLLNI
ncbi:MAG: 2-hydroxychromene-2-carboxylate isomerase, partial [Gammaproteobacteria bacterium]